MSENRKNLNMIKRFAIPNSIIGAWVQYPAIIFILSLFEKLFRPYINGQGPFDTLIIWYGFFGLIYSGYIGHSSSYKKYKTHRQTEGVQQLKTKTRLLTFFLPISSVLVALLIIFGFNGNVDGGVIFFIYIFFMFIFGLWELLFFTVRTVWVDNKGPSFNNIFDE